MDQSTEREHVWYPWARREEQEQQRRVLEHLLQELSPLPVRTVPQLWETLASLLSRTARKMGRAPPMAAAPRTDPFTINPMVLPILGGASIIAIYRTCCFWRKNNCMHLLCTGSQGALSSHPFPTLPHPHTSLSKRRTRGRSSRMSTAHSSLIVVGTRMFALAALIRERPMIVCTDNASGCSLVPGTVSS